MGSTKPIMFEPYKSAGYKGMAFGYKATLLPSGTIFRPEGPAGPHRQGGKGGALPDLGRRRVRPGTRIELSWQVKMAMVTMSVTYRPTAAG